MRKTQNRSVAVLTGSSRTRPGSHAQAVERLPEISRILQQGAGNKAVARLWDSGQIQRLMSARQGTGPQQIQRSGPQSEKNKPFDECKPCGPVLLVLEVHGQVFRTGERRPLQPGETIAACVDEKIFVPSGAKLVVLFRTGGMQVVVRGPTLFDPCKIPHLPVNMEDKGSGRHTQSTSERA